MQNSMGLIPDSVFMTNASQISAERETVTARIAEAGQVNAPALPLLAAPDVRQAWEAFPWDRTGVPWERTGRRGA